MSADIRHPSLAELETWALGEPGPELATRLESHFAGCAECRQLADDLHGLAGGTLEPPAPTPEWSESEVAGALGQLRQRILAQDLVAEAGRDLDGRESAAVLPFETRPAVHAPETAITHRWRLPPWVAAAAGILMAVGFGFAVERQLKVERLRQELHSAEGKVIELTEAARRPLVNIPNVQAEPADDPYRGVAEPVPAAGGAMVSVTSDDAFPKGSWRVLIEDREGKKVDEVDGLRPLAGKLQFVLPPGLLPPGRYQLRLFHDGVAWPAVYQISLDDG